MTGTLTYLLREHILLSMSYMRAKDTRDGTFSVRESSHIEWFFFIFEKREEK